MKFTQIVLIYLGAILLASSSQAAAGGKKVQREGTLEVLHIHNTDKTTRYEYSLRDKSGKKTKLKFNKGKGPSLLTGTKIRVSGEESSNVLALDDSGSSNLQVLALATPNTFGEQKTAVLLVNFQDNQTQPYTVSQANTIVFGDSSNFFKENSFGQTWLSGNVFGWLTLPINQTCSYYNVSAYADQAAKNAGIDLTQYPRRIYVMPRNSACTWSGMGTVGGSPSSSWLNGELDRGAVTHEMGHNFGLWHSHSLDCGATTLGSSCNRSEYGDAFDTMGHGGVHYNAFQKERLGWLNYNQSPAIATVESGSTTVTLAPYAAAGSGIKAVKVLKGVDATTGQKSWYYVEFRQPLGFDSDISRFPWAVNGVLVRTATDGNGDSSDLLDLTPNSSAIDDLSDSPLAVGKSYVDSSAGVTISLLSVSTSGASVSVSLGGATPTPTPTPSPTPSPTPTPTPSPTPTPTPSPTPSCVRANPSVTMSPSAISSVAPGTAASYSITVKNNDNAYCGNSSFNLSRGVPSGWSSSLSNSSLSLSPGTSLSASLMVTSATNAVAGSYAITASAVNSAAPTYSGSASASYSVASVASLSASVVTNKATYLKGDSVYVTASVSSGGLAVSGASVSFAITKPDGSVVNASAVTDTSGRAVYKMRLNRKAVSGTYQVRVNAASGGQSASAVTSFGVP